ncbi:sugar phosphate isomerase/epimerase [Candidatus Woesearchaeota archaeon]|nr:MAG: sugar phosphate isomerase/epimerase [Candidatus Woesearchaeota archaeon]
MKISASYWGRDVNEMYKFIEKCSKEFSVVRLSYWIFGLNHPSVISKLNSYRKKLGISYNVHMLWGNIDLSSNIKNIRLGSIAESKEAIDFLSSIGGGVLNFHPSLKPLFYKFFSSQEKAKLFGNEVESFKEIVSYAKDKGVVIVIENATSFPSNYPEFKRSCNFTFHKNIVDKIKYPNFGVNFDTGHYFQHSHTESLPLPKVFSMVGKRIKYVHAHDNDGSYDQHLAVGKGKFPWPEFLDLLNSYGFNGTLELELSKLSDQIMSKNYLLNLRPEYF